VFAPLEVLLNLGDLQQMVMLAVARLGDEAYGVAIRDELEAVAGRAVSVPTVYVTLVRLEDQGLVRSAEVPRYGQSGRARRVFALTPAGWVALEEARAAMSRLWRGVARP
jgi:PadR family transcriptional regulator PadR